MQGYKSEAIFHLPGGFEHFKMYQQLFLWMDIHKNGIRENVKIGSVYGSPTCIGNGGRIISGVNYTYDELENIKNFYNDFEVPTRFSFTNCLLEERHVHDTYGNLLLEIFSNGNNEVICNSELLENYIRNNYGDKYKYISSTTKRLNSKKEQDEELKKDYYLIVLDYDYNNDFDYLDLIENKDKCEILCNSPCVARCPFRKEHYEYISKAQLKFYNTNADICKAHSMDYENGSVFKQPGELDRYLDMGFKNFKLEGRNLENNIIIETLAYYLIKDNYQERFKKIFNSREKD